MKSNRLGLFFKIFSGYVIAIAIITVLCVVVLSNASSFKSSADFVKQDVLPHTLDAKNLQIHVIQVQQWLTDISATRGAEGYDDGFDEAKDHAEAFTALIDKFKAYYDKTGESDKVSELIAIQKSFNGFYDMGKQMAQAYIDYGPDEGNVFMEKFDPYAEEIYDSVNAFVDHQVELLTDNVHTIDSKSSALMTIGSIISAVSTVLLIVIGLIITRRIVGPVKNVAAILKEISEGDGDLTQRISISSNDEIGDMARYFNETFDKIQNLVRVVKDLCATLGQSANELASSMTETAAAINQISANIKSIKNQTQNQSASVTETGSTMEQISGGIGKLDDLITNQTSNIKESSASIDELIKNIETIAKTVEQNAENMDNLSKSSAEGKASLDKITDALKVVSQESEGLMEISQVISSIAAQTNLLAMNAAIEAAHAGDTGKGFAVVADEVRKLAESSNVQTKTIGEKLSNIKDSISKIIVFAEDVVDKFTVIETEVGIVTRQEENIRGHVEEQSQESRRILQSIAGLNELTQKVQSSSVEMLEGSRQVSEEAKNMTVITEEINGGMNEMATGADQIIEAVNTVNMLSNENKNSIDTLIREVNRFKV